MAFSEVGFPIEDDFDVHMAIMSLKVSLKMDLVVP